MIAYATKCGKRSMAGLRRAGWRLVLSPTGHYSMDAEGFRYCIDNGAWTAHQAGTPWDADGFLDAVERFGAAADFIVAPDIVGGGRESLWLSLKYLVPIRKLAGPEPWILIPAQDGLGIEDFASYIHGPHVCKTGVFIGGTTEYKVEAIPIFGPWCKERRAWCHVGRVNSAKRIQSCALAGVTSFDGTSASRYAVTLPRLDKARRQLALEFGDPVTVRLAQADGGEAC